MIHVNFITLKWGNKYGPEYVNRLYLSLYNLYSGPFTFYCFTDNNKDILSSVVTKDISLLRKEKIKLFTNEKIYLFENFLGNNVLLDLDILITKDLLPYLQEYNFSAPRFLINHKPKIDYVMYSRMYREYKPNYINSSFTTWKDNQLKFVLDFYRENRDIIDFKYKDLDTMLFHCLEKKLDFHPLNICYSFNSYNEYYDYPIILFNNSQGYGMDLHTLGEPFSSLWKKWD